MRILALACTALAATLAAAAEVRPGYVLADGSIQIVADRTMEPLLTRWNELFVRDHPKARIRLVLGDPPVGLDGIIARVSLLAPVAHDAWESEVDPFKRLNGYRPLDIRVGRVGHAAPGRANPPSIYVNAANPLASLSMVDVGRIFTTGQMPSDIRAWNQLDVAGEWERHAIHVYGTRDDGMTVTALRLARFGGRPFVRHYEALESNAEVLQAVAGDRYGIGLAWTVAESAVPASVRRVPLSEARDGRPTLGAYGDVQAGRYPLSPHMHFYLDRRPGAPVDPIARDYVRAALSAEGQRIVAELRDKSAGFVPLDPEEAAREAAKLE